MLLVDAEFVLSIHQSLEVVKIVHKFTLIK